MFSIACRLSARRTLACPAPHTARTSQFALKTVSARSFTARATYTKPKEEKPAVAESLATTSSEFNVSSEIPPPSFSTDASQTQNEGHPDWSKSYFGLSTQAFPKETSDILLAPVDPLDVEIKPDGLIYLPEIKYRRVLNKAFGPGGWGLAPRSETNVGPKIVSREYALVCQGRLVGIARGEQEYFEPSGIPTATEACKSNALMRCCKDLGIASELWDPRFIREFKQQHCTEIFAEHLLTKKKKKLWRRKDQSKFTYPYQE
ncbi:mitochondrial genome maintenance MGM101 [Pluteus cervinus]|uniref:Mitochondrial genome maintenance MGM101 n=1 Tax=Pluteus cervinus TaxID=181527 RepID=A0ACD3B1A2_9AGAR|nr:mitochondrial genome maintenance MGM101 [Pluteus cervinus]